MLRNSLRRAQNDRNGGILRCIALCILSYIEALVEYFNKWVSNIHTLFIGFIFYGMNIQGSHFISSTYQHMNIVRHTFMWDYMDIATLNQASA